jgi:hypothetical protein
MSKIRPTMFSDYDIRVRAYRIWERTGRPEGHAEEHWREALAELEAEKQAKQKVEVPPQPAISRPPKRIIVEETPKAQDEAA